MLQIIGILLVRISACLLVLRMPPVGETKQRHARAIYLLMVFFIVISTASFFILCFQCTPIEGLWNRSLHAHCIPVKTWDLFQRIDGGKSLASLNASSKSLLTMNSFRSHHELHDCESSIHLHTQPANPSEREMGSHDDNPPSLWVSMTV